MKPIIIALLWSSMAMATNYFISTSGADGAAGTSPATAWQHLSKASGAFSPVDTISLKRGDHWRGEALAITSSGTSGSPITIGDYGTGALPEIDGSQFAPLSGSWTNSSGFIWQATWTFSSNMAWQSGTTPLTPVVGTPTAAGQFSTNGSIIQVWLVGNANPTGIVEATTSGANFHGVVESFYQNWLVFQNLYIKNSNYTGIYLDGVGNSIVRWNTLEQTFQNAIQIVGNLEDSNSNNIQVIGNTCTNSGSARLVAGQAEGVCINAQGWTGTNLIQGNTVTNEDGEGIQTDGGTTNLTITQNRVINPGFVGIYIGACCGNGGHTTNPVVSYNYVELGASSQGQNYAVNSENVPTTVTASAGVITPTFWGYQWINQFPVIFTGTIPSGLSSGTLYYIRDITGSGSGVTFKVSASPGGTAISFSSTGSVLTLNIAYRIDGMLFHHNIAKGTTSSWQGLLFGSGQDQASIHNSVIAHNVFVNDSGNNTCVVSLGPVDDASNVFYNNICDEPGTSVAYNISPVTTGVNVGTSNSVSDYTANNEVIWGLGGVFGSSSTIVQWPLGTGKTLAAWQATGQALNSVVADPKFTNIASDWTLQAGSPAIGMAKLLNGVQQERTRMGTVADAGAFAYVAGHLGSARDTSLGNRYKAVIYP